MKSALYAAVALLGLLAIPVQAQTYYQGFEDVSPQFFQSPVLGSSSDGSTMDITTEVAHNGRHAARLSYQFTKRGYIDLALAQAPIVVSHGDDIRLAMWIYGSGQNDFPSGGSLNLLDAGGETFQYHIGTPLADALDGTGWHIVKAEVTLSKFNGHWGGKNTGVIKLPMRFLGFGLDHWPDAAAGGEVYFDDVLIKGSNSSSENNLK